VPLHGCILCTDGKSRVNIAGGQDVSGSSPSSADVEGGSGMSSFVRSRSNPNVFSIIARHEEAAGGGGKGKGRGVDIPLSTFSGAVDSVGRLSSRRYFLTAPTRQLRLDWMAAIAPFASQTVGDPEVVAELQEMVEQRRRVREEALAAAEVDGAEETGLNSVSDAVPASGAAATPEFIARMVSELDTFAFSLPQNRQAVMLAGLVHSKPSLSSGNLLEILEHLVFDDDREMLVALALQHGCLDAATAEDLLSDENAARVLRPLERDALEWWLEQR
jgi:hypothetical protein